MLAETDPARSLGKAMAWARQQELTDLHLLVEDDAGVLARRAAQFADPPTIWWLRGAELHATEPEPYAPPRVSSSTPELEAFLERAGLEVVRERSHVAGELRGLEVARVVDGRLEVGVGEADRELTAMLHGDLEPPDALERVVTIVGEHRRPDAPRHPLNQLVPERWLRWMLRNEPERVGAHEFAPAPSPRPRAGLRERDIACARADESVVVCSVGVDLELVPAAAEARHVLDPGAPLVLVVPDRDDHPITHALARRLAAPAELVTISGDWRT
ncbi:MAG TPA: hypothetical protein VGZ52_08075 [Acidimicrobiales bacterium]|nr:hypothetical protein [Acidimicrobiales bacterium]